MFEIDTANSRMVDNLTNRFTDLSAFVIYIKEQGIEESEELLYVKQLINLAIKAHKNIFMFNKQQYDKLFNLSNKLILYGCK